MSLNERLDFNYWGTLLMLLKVGLPYETILELSSKEINIILGYEAAVSEKEAEARERQQRIANNG